MVSSPRCSKPVPKTPHPRSSSDYRPVALMSHIMKTLERLILEQVWTMVSPHLDPFQFTYQPRLEVEDATIYKLDRVCVHLDQPASNVKITFFDFSRVFNNIRPVLLGEKLTVKQVGAPLVSWITDYLIDRPQYVRLQSFVGCA